MEQKKLKCKKCGQASLVRECDGGDWVFVCRMDGYMIRKCLKCGSLMRIGTTSEELVPETLAKQILDSFENKKDYLQLKAMDLVPKASVLSKSFKTVITESALYSNGEIVLLTLPDDIIELIFICAYVYFALEALHILNITDELKASLILIITENLKEKGPRALEILNDCTTYVRSYFSNLDPSEENLHSIGDAIGLWVIGNLMGKNPEGYEVMQAARHIGMPITVTMRSWWFD